MPRKPSAKVIDPETGGTWPNIKTLRQCQRARKKFAKLQAKDDAVRAANPHLFPVGDISAGPSAVTMTVSMADVERMIESDIAR